MAGVGEVGLLEGCSDRVSELDRRGVSVLGVGFDESV